MFILPYLKCLSPIIFGALAILGYVFARKIIRAVIISKPIPQMGFASIEDEIRYVNDEPAEVRRIWGYKATIIFVPAFVIVVVLAYLIPAMVIK